jgi:quercetin dioxygenase-like cupin family protein
MTASGSETALLPLLQAIGSMRRHAGAASFAVVERTLGAGAMPPLHVHEEDEAFYVLEGSMTIYVGDEAFALEAGAAFVAPKDVPHTYRADSRRVRFLAAAFVASVSRYEDFLRAVSRPAPDGPPEAGEIAAIAAANAITVLGRPGVRPSDADRPRASLAA